MLFNLPKGRENIEIEKGISYDKDDKPEKGKHYDYSETHHKTGGAGSDYL